jgi:hypothetical protein
MGTQTGSVVLEFCGGPDGHRMYSRKNEEYIADFCLMTHRILDGPEQRLFRYHYLLGADWRLCELKLHLDRGEFYHAVYRIESKLGQAFAEVTPYPLFPLDEYFGGTIRKEPQVAYSEYNTEEFAEHELAEELQLSMIA